MVLRHICHVARAYAWLILISLSLASVTARAADVELKPGDQAPAFSLPGSDGKTHALADYRGKQAVVLAWFPKAFTPGCTNECKSFRAGGDKLRQYNVAYFTISCDDAATNRKFAESLSLDYPILADADRAVAKAFGVIAGEKKVAARWTFYLGPDGKILHIDKTVKTATHADDVATQLDKLGVAKKTR